MKRKFKRSICMVTVILLMTTFFTACSSSTAEKEMATQQKAEKAEPTSASAPTPAPTPTPTLEPTPEPTQEPVTYEGIDMESTLPGKEWMATFKGIIKKPVFVVHNDETNKKVIVEDGEKVEFAEGDTLAVYEPEGYILSACKGENVEVLLHWNEYYNEVTFKEGSSISTDVITVEGYVGESMDEMDEITCTITAEQD